MKLGARTLGVIRGTSAILQLLLKGPGYATGLAEELQSLGLEFNTKQSAVTALQRLKRNGYVERCAAPHWYVPHKGNPGLFYRLTGKGRAVATKERAILQDLIDATAN